MTPKTLRDLIEMNKENFGYSDNQKHNADNDAVNQPKHYLVGGIEAIDYMKAKSTPEEFRGHLRLTAIKYLSRAGHKDDVLQEYKKAMVYLDWLIKDIETGKIK